jgi:hypothetical protein
MTALLPHLFVLSVITVVFCSLYIAYEMPTKKKIHKDLEP